MDFSFASTKKSVPAFSCLITASAPAMVGETMIPRLIGCDALGACAFTRLELIPARMSKTYNPTMALQTNNDWIGRERCIGPRNTGFHVERNIIT
jgi:hypothetical protein